MILATVAFDFPLAEIPLEAGRRIPLEPETLEILRVGLRLALTLTRARVVATVDDAGRWTSNDPITAATLADFFGPAYLPSGYWPGARPAAVAHDVALALGGTVVGEAREDLEAPADSELPPVY